MPRVSVWLVRASLAHLAAGVSLGAVLLAAKGGWLAAGGAGWIQVHREVVVAGWLVQLAVGVGFWILPPVRSAAVRERPAWAAVALLNAGVLLYAAGALGAAALPAAGALRVAGRGAELAAVLAFGVPLATKPFR